MGKDAQPLLQWRHAAVYNIALWRIQAAGGCAEEVAEAGRAEETVRREEQNRAIGRRTACGTSLLAAFAGTPHPSPQAVGFGDKLDVPAADGAMAWMMNDTCACVLKADGMVRRRARWCSWKRPFYGVADSADRAPAPARPSSRFSPTHLTANSTLPFLIQPLPLASLPTTATALTCRLWRELGRKFRAGSNKRAAAFPAPNGVPVIRRHELDAFKRRASRRRVPAAAQRRMALWQTITGFWHPFTHAVSVPWNLDTCAAVADNMACGGPRHIWPLTSTFCYCTLPSYLLTHHTAYTHPTTAPSMPTRASQYSIISIMV